MGSDLVAIGMLLTIAVTIYTHVRFHDGKVRWRFLWIGLFAWLIGLSIILPMSHHGNGIPLVIFTVTLLCAIWTFHLPVCPLHYHRLLSTFIIVMMLVLTGYSQHLIFDTRIMSFSAKHEYLPYSLTPYLIDIAMKDSKPDLPSYPPGWLSDQPFAKDIPEKSLWGIRKIPHARWHSWFTGLYPYEVKPVAAWFTGGWVETTRITFRERPDKKPPIR